MVEVFKTNVENHAEANMLLHEIHKSFAGHEANFDLEDCDKILRVKCKEGIVEPSLFASLLSRFGFHAEVLPDLPCLRYQTSKIATEIFK